MTIASSNLPKIGVGVSKEKYKSHTSSSTSKKVIPASAYLKNYFGSDSNFRFWLKPKQLCKVSCLVSVLILESLVSSQSRYPKISSRLGIEALCLDSTFNLCSNSNVGLFRRRIVINPFKLIFQSPFTGWYFLELVRGDVSGGRVQLLFRIAIFLERGSRGGRKSLLKLVRQNP